MLLYSSGFFHFCHLFHISFIFNSQCLSGNCCFRISSHFINLFKTSFSCRLCLLCGFFLTRRPYLSFSIKPLPGCCACSSFLFFVHCKACSHPFAARYYAKPLHFFRRNTVIIRNANNVGVFVRYFFHIVRCLSLSFKISTYLVVIRCQGSKVPQIQNFAYGFTKVGARFNVIPPS